MLGRGRVRRPAARFLLFGDVLQVVLALMLGLAGSASDADAGAVGTGEVGPVSGLPLPRFVSLKSDEVNLRAGPGREYPTQWVFRRAGLPLEVLKEFDSWREVRDADGVTGWVNQTLLSGRRTALVLPWEVKPDGEAVNVPLRESDSDRARPVAMVAAGVIANVHTCDSRWCDVTIDGYRGYIEQNRLWGVYAGEIVK